MLLGRGLDIDEFYASKEWKTKTTSFSFHSARIAQIKFMVSRTNPNVPSYGGPNYEGYTRFLDDLTAVINEEWSTSTIIIGSFNSIVGAQTSGEQSVGNLGLGRRDSRGQQLI